MSAVAIIKRLVAAMIVLAVLGGIALAVLFHRINANPETEKKAVIILEHLEKTFSEEDGTFTRIGALIAAWWNSDEILAEAHREAKYTEMREKERVANSFADDSYSDANDYYGTID